MIAAEEWYAYQKQYQKYGLDLKPEEEEASRRAHRKQEREAARTKGLTLKVQSDHRVMFSLVMAAAVVLMIIVVMVSYAAKVTYDINTIKAENDVIAGEIEDLDVRMMSANTVIYIESQAKKQLGMKSPDTQHCVYLSTTESPAEGFADMLKAKAYK